MNGISKDQVSRICKELDGQVHPFRTRPLGGVCPYLMLDATFEKVRENGRVVSMAVVIAVGVRSSGERKVLGTDWAGRRPGVLAWRFSGSWSAVACMASGWVTSDSHLGLKQAVAQVLTGRHLATVPGPLHAQRAVDRAPRRRQQMVAAILRTIFFAQPDREGARETIPASRVSLSGASPSWWRSSRRPRLTSSPLNSFPLEHRRQIWSTNALERLNREVGHRCELVGIFPNWPSLLRFVGGVLEEQNDGWAVGRRYFSQESMHNLIEPTPEELVQALRAADRIITVEPHAAFLRHVARRHRFGRHVVASRYREECS